MSSKSIGRGLDNLTAVAWATPVVVVIAYPFLPSPLDSGVLMWGVIVAGLIFASRRRPWRVTFMTIAWSALPLGFPYVEARVFEARVRRDLSEFQTAAELILRGDVGPCWGPIRSAADCDINRFPPAPRAMTTGVYRQSRSVRFTFKEGSRRSLIYEPRQSAEPSGPCRPIATGWSICFG
jgi:hypothetical protein